VVLSRRERRSYNREMSDFIVGLTGGVASGKSEVQRRFEALGVYVADADAVAREAVARGAEGLREVIETFGKEVLDAGGELDRAAMRRRIFEDAEAKRRLEAIIHPRVRTELYQSCLAASTPYAMAAIPLLAEGGGKATYPWLARILVVDADPATQLSRLLARDGIDATLAARMLAGQATREQRLAIADDVIDNNGTLEDLDRAVTALDTRYLALARDVPL
jgi:dephospho-CoA kinase